jgi:outer membrane receptor protein involved in Fe transport
MFFPSFFGGQQLNIRGFAGRQLHGTSVLLDSVPINTLDNGTPMLEINSLQLNVLDRIEMVRGPGSTVYGGDAFQGVVGLHSYTSDEDKVAVDAETGIGDFYRSALRLSRSLTEGVRLHMAFGYTHQGNEDIRYRYTDPDTGSRGTGTWRNEIEALTGIAKIETDPTQPLSARIGLYYSESKSVDFPGFGTFNSNGDSVLRDRDHSGGDNQFNMVSGALVQQLPKDIELEVNGFYWDMRRLRTLQNTPAVVLDVENDNYRMGANIQLQPGALPDQSHPS